MQHRLLKTFSGFVFASFALILKASFEGLGFDMILSALLAIVIASSIFMFIDPFISNFPRSFQYFRKQSDNRALAEGWWLEIMVHEENEPVSYSVIEIGYDKKFDDYFMNGLHFTCEGEYVRKFNAKRLFLEKDRNNVMYHYKAVTELKSGTRTEGIGLIEFVESNSQYLSATGFFADENGMIPNQHFEWRPISKSEFLESIDKKKPKNREDLQLYVKWVNQNDNT